MNLLKTPCNLPCLPPQKKNQDKKTKSASCFRTTIIAYIFNMFNIYIILFTNKHLFSIEQF